MNKLDALRCRWDVCLGRHPLAVMVMARIRVALTRFNMRAVELMLGFLALITGFWIGWPWHNVYGSDNAYYRLLISYMPSWAWTAGFMLASVPSIIFMGKEHWKLVTRLLGMGVLLSAWVLASLLFVLDHAPYLATAWTPVFALYQAMAMLAAWLNDAPAKTCSPNQSS